jgi:DNA-binding beta-propeller fold protein YncE
VPITPTPERHLPRYTWLIGGVIAGGVLLLLVACGDLLLNLEKIFQTVTIAGATPTPTHILEPSELASLTPGIKHTSTPRPSSSPTPTLVADTPTALFVAPPTSTPLPLFPTPTPVVDTPTPLPVFAKTILTFGGEGIGPGLFEDARSIAVDEATGNIYVGEYSGGRIQVFDADGEFITQWLADPEMPLRGMDVDRQGNVYIVQSGLIYQYNGTDGTLQRELEYNAGWGFDDVTVGADGGLVAAWSGGEDNIVRFNSNGDPNLTITNAISGQSGDSELDTRVAVDGLGNIYALGVFNSTVFKFGPDGKFLDQFGHEGEQAIEFAPDAIAVDGQGRIYVSNSPIKVFDVGGQFIASIEIPQAFGLTFDDEGYLYVAARTKVVKLEIEKPQ